MSTAIDRLATTIGQTKGFRSPSQAGVVAILLTADRLRRHIEGLIAAHADLTQQQYNVLRILRGAGDDGLPTLDVAGRMIERSPGMSRMMDRLERKGLIRRERSASDRRQVRCRISDDGIALLNQIDPVVERADNDALGHIDPRQVSTLIATLERCRDHLDSGL